MERGNWCELSADEVAASLRANLKGGLSEREARERLVDGGQNVLPVFKKISLAKLIWAQFSNLIVWLLIVATVVALALGEWVDAGAILVIIILNALIGFFQEYHAEETLAALKNLEIPLARVIRDGKLMTIPSTDLVVGDVVQLEAGDRVPADGRLFYKAHLSTVEAELTGESLPVYKEIEPLMLEAPSLGEQKNRVFMGTTVVTGKGRFLVTETGAETELGKIATLLKEAKEEKTPLQKRLDRLGQILVWSCLVVIVVVFILGTMRGFGWADLLLTGLSLAVAAIPEGLPAVVTIALAIGVKKMAKRHALIRRLPSVETLGCTEVICTDKTGTLTQNEMVVTALWIGGDYIDVSGLGYAPIGKFEKNHHEIDPKEHPDIIQALKTGTLCNSASLYKKNGSWEIAGDPTEGALLVAAAKGGLQKESLEASYVMLNEVPFDAKRKMMSVLVDGPGGKETLVKGAPDRVLECCKMWKQDGKELLLDTTVKEAIAEANRALAQQGLRVLALAFTKTQGDDPVEKQLTFLGLIALRDPPRQEVKGAIKECIDAGIRPVMITGDHPETAWAVARELGLVGEEEHHIEGKELDVMPDKQLEEVIPTTSVFSRTSPEQKYRIVKMWKKLGKVVAVTGDGVNDAPAIKEADIGVAMGLTGTDVTKEASDMVITDDNFASIVHAVEEGRGIYDNIIKFVNYLISSNIAEILIIFIALIFGLRDPSGHAFIPLTAVQLLWLNLVTDGLPAIALGLDPIDPTVMERKPRQKGEPILSLKFATQLFSVSVVMTLGILLALFYGLKISAAHGQTMTLTAFVLLKLVRVQMVRSQYRIGFFSNPWVIFALVSSLVLQLIITYVPGLQEVFGMVPLGSVEWGILIVISAFVWAGSLGVNWLFRKGR